MQRNKVKVKHLIVESDGGDWPPGNADLFLKWFSDHISEIPDECRDSARIEINSFIFGDEYEPEGSLAEIEITYLRDESDEEMDRRIFLERLSEERARTEVERVERQVLAELKKKYEG